MVWTHDLLGQGGGEREIETDGDFQNTDVHLTYSEPSSLANNHGNICPLEFARPTPCLGCTLSLQQSCALVLSRSSIASVFGLCA